jgi:hypothetical protein
LQLWLSLVQLRKSKLEKSGSLLPCPNQPIAPLLPNKGVPVCLDRLALLVLLERVEKEERQVLPALQELVGDLMVLRVHRDLQA